MKGPKKAAKEKILAEEKKRARRPRAAFAVAGRKLDFLSVRILMKLAEPVLKDQATERARNVSAFTVPGTFLPKTACRPFTAG